MRLVLKSMTNYHLIIIVLSLILISPIIAYSQNNGYTITTKNTELNSLPNSIPIAYGIAVLAVLIIMFSSAAIIKQFKPSSFFDMIRDANWYPSLPRFQFLIWTCVILFAFFAVYLIRILNGVLEPLSTMPENLLILMGISIISPVAGKALSSIKYGQESASSHPSKEEMKKRRFYTMLYEGSKPSLSRVQMFSWTWLAITIYLLTFFSYVGIVAADYTSNKTECDKIYSILGNNSTASVTKQFKCMHDLTIPNVDETFVVLMGLSQGAYLGGKFVSHRKTVISLVSVTEIGENLEIFILGQNFGQSGVVKINDVIKDVDPKNWSEEKIKLILKKDLVPKEGKTTFVVISNGVSSDVYDNSQKQS